MYLRRSATVKYFIAGLVGAVLYCEWAIYLIQPHYWHEVECNPEDTTCTRILFIADPQIQGDLAVPPPLNYLFNWDSDRYLKSTFSVVLKHFKPDVLVYLGDLMDEGSISTMVQFHGYALRLSNIFEVHHHVVQVWVPGDNDIGGENEPIMKEKVLEFEKVFEQGSVIQTRNISLYKVNAITHTYPKKPEGVDDRNLKMVVSHYPVTSKHVFGHQVNNEIRPNIYFCAHDHESKYVIQDKDLSNREGTHWILPRHKPLSISFNQEKLYEIYVPTCSYRMGTSSIGYGAAILENNNERMKYTVFWSPSRFPYLFLYLAVLVILIIYCMVFCAARIYHRLKPVGKSSDKVPLLDSV